MAYDETRLFPPLVYSFRGRAELREALAKALKQAAGKFRHGPNYWMRLVRLRRRAMGISFYCKDRWGGFGADLYYGAGRGDDPMSFHWYATQWKDAREAPQTLMNFMRDLQEMVPVIVRVIEALTSRNALAGRA